MRISKKTDTFVSNWHIPIIPETWILGSSFIWPCYLATQHLVAAINGFSIILSKLVLFLLHYIDYLSTQVISLLSVSFVIHTKLQVYSFCITSLNNLNVIVIRYCLLVKFTLSPHFNKTLYDHSAFLSSCYWVSSYRHTLQISLRFHLSLLTSTHCQTLFI